MYKKMIPLVLFLISINFKTCAKNALKTIKEIKIAFAKKDLDTAEKLVAKLKEKAKKMPMYKEEATTQEKNLLTKKLERETKKVEKFERENTKLKNAAVKFKNQAAIDSEKIMKLENKVHKQSNEIKKLLRKPTPWKEKTKEQKEIKKLIDQHKKELEKKYKSETTKATALYDQLQKDKKEFEVKKTEFVKDIKDLTQNLNEINKVVPEQIKNLHKNIEQQIKDLEQSKNIYEDYKQFMPQAKNKSDKAKKDLIAFLKKILDEENFKKGKISIELFVRQYQNYQTFSSKSGLGEVSSRIHKDTIKLFEDIIKNLETMKQKIKSTQKLSKKLKHKYSKPTLLKKIKKLF